MTGEDSTEAAARTEIELPLRRWTQGTGLERTVDRVAVEGAVEIVAAGVRLARLQCLPRDIEDLAVGFLLAEGLVESPEMIGGVRLLDGASPAQAGSEPGVPVRRVELELPGADAGELARRVSEMTLASGCGKALFSSEVRRRTFAAPARGFSAEEIVSAVRDVERRGELFKSTGCVHAAAAWRDAGRSDAPLSAVAQAGDSVSGAPVGGGKLLAFREDIGRHNAVDKVAGAVARTGGDLRGALLVSTGRLTAEVAAKSVRLGVWGLASRSAATARAVELAAEFGMVLVGFVRGKRLNVYCGAERLREDP